MKKEKSPSAWELIEALEELPVSKWPTIYCKLNSWGWPEELQDIKPIGWDGGSWDYQGHYIVPLQRRIEYVCGKKRLSWEHNKSRMTRWGFEWWWRMSVFFRKHNNWTGLSENY